MDKNSTEFNDQGKHYITRRQAIRMGGIVAAGLIFSRPIIDTILPRPLFAQYGEPPQPPPPPPPPEDEGCTPGYWKNHLDAWGPTGFGTGDDFDTTFDLLGVPGGAYEPDRTLLNAIEAEFEPPPDQPLDSLAWHGVAALLNAAHPDVNYPLTVNQVIIDWKTAFLNGVPAMETQKEILEAFNETVCVLN